MTTPRFELTRFPIVKKLLLSRWIPWLLMVIALPIFVLAILAGLFGTPAGNRNFGIIFVWIVWWGLLILVLVPFTGRLWCAICPIPGPGEWLQRRALIEPRGRGKLFTRGLKWPKRLNNIWLQNAIFMAVTLFSKVILTTPVVSSIVLALFALAAVAASILFERRIFCRYLCPVGGFIAIYSQVAPLEVRVKDPAVCVAHPEKDCYTGNANGYGCPWLVFPATLSTNTNCGMCMECLKTCPKDNMGVFIRPFSADLVSVKGRRLDEAFRGFIMLTCALVYAAVLTGPWAFIREAAHAVGTPGWWLYAIVFVAANLLLVPGLFYGCTALLRRLAHTATPVRRLFVDYAYALLPLGLGAWAGFSLSFVLTNVSYAWQVVSDPFGWGWNLFGTAQWTWTPYLSAVIPYLQIAVVLLGLVAAIGIISRTTRERQLPQHASLPVVVFCAVFTIALFWVFV